MALEERGLTPQRERFAQLVAEGKMTHTQAYRLAYPKFKGKPTTANEEASRMVNDPAIAARIAELKEAALQQSQLRAVEVLAEVRKLAHSDIANVMNDDGTVKLPHELNPATRAAVKKFKIDELGRIEYEFYDKGQALDKAMRHLGLYERDNQQQAGGLAALLGMLTGSVVRPRPSAAQPDDEDDVIDV
jgi:hypothetical protein